MLRISWSGLRTHETCKQRGYQHRQGTRNQQENQRVFFPGTVTDRVVRDWLMTDPTPGLMPDMVPLIVEREWKTITDAGGIITWKDAKDRDKVIADCREAVTKIEPSLLKLVVPYNYQADKGFKAPVKVPHPKGGFEEITLIGYMDILVQDDKDRWWVWDVKHTRDNSYWRKTEGQLTFYDLAVELMFGKPTVRVGLLQPLCTEQVKPFTVDADKRAQMLQRISGMAADIWNDVKTPRTDTKECGWCNVKHSCTKFQPVVIDGKKRIAF